MSRYEVKDRGCFQSWLDSCDDNKRRLGVAFLEALANGPELLRTFDWTRTDKGRRISACDFADAGILVTFAVTTAPVRAVFIIDVLEYR